MDFFSCLTTQIDLLTQDGVFGFVNLERCPSIPSSIVFDFARMLWLKDKYTYCHSCRVARLSRTLARELRINEKKCDFIYVCAFLHDIGKLKISNTILKKSGMLTQAERCEIQRHSQYGQSIVETIPELKAAGKIIRHHHEKINGHGYPDRLKGNEIPYEARIIAITDSYDAMRSRIYSTRKTQTDSLREIKINIDSQFDAEIASSFVDIQNI